MSDDAAAETEPKEPTRRFAAREVTTYIEWGALGFAVLAALVAGVGFYSNVSRIITIWVSEPYQPVFSAAFNLAVLLVAGGAVVWLARRLS